MDCCGKKNPFISLNEMPQSNVRCGPIDLNAAQNVYNHMGVFTGLYGKGAGKSVQTFPGYSSNY